MQRRADAARPFAVDDLDRVRTVLPRAVDGRERGRWRVWDCMA